MRRKKSSGEYLAYICAKYELNPDTFFCALLSAGENQRSKCGDLLIECRGKTRDKAMFLITADSRIVAQLSVSRKFLSQGGNPLRQFVEADIIRNHIAKKAKGPTSCSIRDLRAGMSRVNLKAKIIEVTEPRIVLTRYGNYASIAKALIEDETGTIKLCLWNDQIAAVSAGDYVQIENAQATRFRGEKQLSLGKTGSLTNVELA